MQQIDPEASTEVVLARMSVLSIRLKSRPDTAALAVDVDGPRETLKAKHEAWKACAEEASAATGGVTFADEVEDDEVADLARKAKVEVDGVLKDPWYQGLFAEAPSVATDGTADEKQRQFVDQVLMTLATPDYAALSANVPALKASHEEVRAARVLEAEWDNREALAWNQVQLAEQACRDAYRDTEPALMLVFPGQKRKVESFFYRPRKAKKVTGGGDAA